MDLFNSDTVSYKNKSIAGKTVESYANSFSFNSLDFIQRRSIIEAVRRKNKSNKEYSLSSKLLFDNLNISDSKLKGIEELIKIADQKKIVSPGIKKEIQETLFKYIEIKKQESNTKEELQSIDRLNEKNFISASDYKNQWNKNSKRKTKQDLKRKIRNKIFSFEIALNLAISNPNSPLFKSYLNTINFCQSIYQQDGYKITSRYCNCRHCYSCNRIRSGKLINSYQPLVNVMENKFMVTLTIPNVSHEILREKILEMKENFTLIKDVLRKRKIKFLGLRKLECTYNQTQNSYHPHFHILVNGLEASETLKNLWLEYYPEASSLAQDVREADSNSVKELFKYFTKFWSKKKNNTETIIDYNSQDKIYNAIANIRIFQSFGITKKVKELMKCEIDENEDIDLKENSYFNIDPIEDIYYYNPLENNFVSPDSGALLIDNKLNKKDTKLLQAFNSSINWSSEKIKQKEELLDPLLIILESNFVKELIPDQNYFTKLNCSYTSENITDKKTDC